MDIRYIGRKPLATDRLFGTGCMWPGPGSVAACDDEKAGRKLLAYNPHEFVEVEEGDEWAPDGDGGPDPDDGEGAALADITIDLPGGTRVPLASADHAAAFGYLKSRWPHVYATADQSVEDLRTAISRLHESEG